MGKKESQVIRITPAYAGKSSVDFDLWYSIRDHPRVCGEKQILMYALIGSAGSPPRMRGKDIGRRALCVL